MILVIDNCQRLILLGLRLWSLLRCLLSLGLSSSVVNRLRSLHSCSLNRNAGSSLLRKLRNHLMECLTAGTFNNSLVDM